MDRKQDQSVDLRLPPDQVRYLQRLRGVEGDLSLSAVFAALVEYAALDLTPATEQATSKTRLHLSISDAHLRLLDQAARRAGLMRSEAALRLIQHASAKGFSPWKANPPPLDASATPAPASVRRT